MRKDSNKAVEQLVAWQAANPWQHEPIVDNVTCLIVGAECKASTTPSGIPAMVMA